ncbi:hypothetical protein Tco_1580189 [Tanacetum coccineum]
MYTPSAPPVEYGGLFGNYLKKLSLARTRRAKDREPFIESCPKVVSLKDRVKALEGLCDTLMIIPKEIKSLKARIYKLETIINERIKRTKRRKNSKKTDKKREKDKTKSEDGKTIKCRISPTQQERKSKDKIIKKRTNNDKSSKSQGFFWKK